MVSIRKRGLMENLGLCIRYAIIVLAGSEPVVFAMAAAIRRAAALAHGVDGYISVAALLLERNAYNHIGKRCV